MNTRWQAVSTLWLSACACAALGSPGLTRLHSFGSAVSSAANSCAELTLGSDGALYGTTAAGGQTGQGTVFRMNQDGSGFRLLKAFGLGTNDGLRTFSAVLEGKDGALYGTTEEGGEFGFGTLFKLGNDGSNFGVLRSFSGGPDGAYPEGGLLEGSDGLLYGTTSGGGTNDNGLVFRMAKDGSGFTALLQFTGTNGENPESELIEASDGMLYGTTCSGDSTNLGTIFQLQKDGTEFAVLQRFFYTATVKTNGASPLAHLVEGTNGMLYGTTSTGGSNSMGTIYALNKDGSGFNTLYQFSANTTTDGRISLGALTLASDGVFYGTTFDGGTNGNGTVFRINHDGTGYAVVASLVSPQGPAAALIETTNGILYGTSQFGGDSGDGTVFALQKDGGAFTVLASFSASGGDGQSAYSAPIGTSGNLLFGTTRTGGSLAQGTVYSLRFDGVGYDLVSDLQGTGGNPVASLLEATNGFLYGVTSFGGSSNSGTIFRLAPSGSNLTTIYSPGDSSAGREFRASLIQASDGRLYGTTVYAGSAGEGTVFRIDPDGSNYFVLKNCSSASGANPMQRLLEASDHILYGASYGGGISNRGVIFSLTKDGSTYSVLKSLGSPATDGESPMSPLLDAGDGMLYGTAYGGGTTNNAGTLFRLNKDGSAFGVVRSFTGLGADGRHPSGDLVEWIDGSIYGTTERGGTNDQGTLFRVNKDGSGYAVLAGFGGSLGAYPRGGLAKGPDGALYGTTDQGSDMNFGAVFRYGSQFGEILDLKLVSRIPNLRCLGQPGTNYFLEQTLQLGPAADWLQLTSTNAPPNGQFEVPDPASLAAGNQQTFYRLRR